jgi:hypothetical protein
MNRHRQQGRHPEEDYPPVTRFFLTIRGYRLGRPAHGGARFSGSLCQGQIEQLRDPAAWWFGLALI